MARPKCEEALSQVDRMRLNMGPEQDSLPPVVNGLCSFPMRHLDSVKAKNLISMVDFLLLCLFSPVSTPGQGTVPGQKITTVWYDSPTPIQL